MAKLTPESFELLLARLAGEPSKAAEKYEELRLKLIKCLTWKGCPESQADALADEILDRIAGKLAQGVEIENLNAFACKVLHYVWLEHQRKHKEDGYDDDKMAVIKDSSPLPDNSDSEDQNIRLACLRLCLVEVTKDDEERKLILDYYNTEDVNKLKNQRKSLAERLGLKVNALKVKVCRLRAKLEECINECVEKRLSPVTKA